MKKAILLIVVAISLLACSEKYDSSVYIGSYRIFDRQIPHPYFIELSNNHITYLNNKGKELESVKLDSTLASGDTIGLNEHLFYFKFVNDSNISLFDLRDTSNYYKRSQAEKLVQKNFTRFKKVLSKPTDLKEAQEKLSSRSWDQVLDSAHYSTPNRDFKIVKNWQVSADSIIFSTHYYYQEQVVLTEFQRTSYALFDLNGNVVLSLFDEEENPLPIYQLFFDGTNQIRLIDYNSRYSTEIELSQTKQELDRMKDEKPQRFANCFEGFQGEYYFDDLTYLHGNDSIQKRCNVNFPENEKREGYIIIHFNLNCNKQVGNLGLIQMDFEYLPTSFNLETVRHLVSQVKSLKDWPDPQSSRVWMPYKDVHSFLMFKIQNGRITDVSP